MVWEMKMGLGPGDNDREKTGQGLEGDGTDGFQHRGSVHIGL